MTEHARSDVARPWAAPDVPDRSVRQRSVFLVACVAAGAVLAIPGALIWIWLADPPSAPAAQDDRVLWGELQFDQQVGVTMWFILVGFAVCAVAGLVVGWLGQRFGWVTVVGVLAMCSIAGGLGAVLGEHVLGPDQQAQLAAAGPGDVVTASLSVGTPIAYLAWPIGGLVGAIGAIVTWSRPIRPLLPPPSSTVRPGA